MKKVKFLLTIFLLSLIYIYVLSITLISNEIVLLNNEEFEYKLLPGINVIETQTTSSDNFNVSNVEFKLLNAITLKNVKLTKINDIEVVPIGKIIGLKLYTNGVLIVGKSEIEDLNSNLIRPYENTDITEGDTILKINGSYIENIESLKNAVNSSNGLSLNLTILRDGNTFTSNIIPVKSKSTNEYKLGLWVKDSATGVGTITFYEPTSQSFAVLGHGITDSDTDSLIDIDYGELVTSRIVSIKKGENESPGEIRGTVLNQETIGTVEKNTSFGVYGTLDNLTSLNIDTSKKVKVASRDEITLGEASILCSVDSSNVAKEYSIEIEKVYLDNNSNNKSMLIRVTDEELIEKTGGIIRGLSGAPIIQNGKFIGAITNVLVSNPEIGYGIFADLMIKQLESN